jgi:hypothetical protein
MSSAPDARYRRDIEASSRLLETRYREATDIDDADASMTVQTNLPADASLSR